jgi:DNA-binding MarR family transcriptional regulator
MTEELFDLGIALDLIGNAAAGRIGLNQTDLIGLNLLVRHGPMSPSQLASSVGLTTAAISAMASRLEAGGYASREVDLSDRRRVIMRASPTGTEQAFSLFNDLYQATTDLSAEYSQRELKRMLELVRRFRVVLTDQAAAIRAPKA